MSEPGILPNPIPFGKYYLLERVNVGGMAEVYKAKAFGVEGFERLLAVKKILSSIAEDESFINMFIDEAKIAGQLNHPNIAQIFDLGKVEGSYFIALEYISGKDLKTIFERARRLGEKVSIPRVCYLIMKVCEGLAHAHAKTDAQGNDLGIVHRDVSPQNVLLSYEGEVKIIDFGIAKAQGKTSQTQVGILKGKFSYMSPEQVRGLHVDHRSDLFSLGIVLYELLTLERLFLGESDFDTLEKIRKVEMSPPSLYNPHIPKELEDIVLRALAKSPDDRFQSAGEFAEAIERFMRNQGYYYTNKDLAAYMKESFNADIEFENKKLEYYRSLNLKPLEKAASADADAPHLDEGLAWGEEEMETQIFDRNEEEGEEISDEDIVYASEVDEDQDLPTVEYDRWDGEEEDEFTFDDEPPDNVMGRPSRQKQPTAQMSAVEPRRSSPGTVQSSSNKGRSPFVVIGLVALVVVLIGGAALWKFSPRPAPITFETEPSSVKVVVDGELVHDGPTPFTYELEPGPATIELKREGYETYKTSQTIESGTSYNMTQQLKPLEASGVELLVKTDPPGAELKIDGEGVGEPTPYTIKDLEAGTHTITASKEGYFEEAKQLDLKGDETVELKLRPTEVALTVTSEPDRAKYTVFEDESGDRVASGRTPDTVKEIDASKTYRVEVERGGYEDAEKPFEPGHEAEATLAFELDRDEPETVATSDPPRDPHPPVKPPPVNDDDKKVEDPDPPPKEKEKEKEKKVTGTGVVSVASKPAARVFIDGQDTGRHTPLINFKIKAGKHEIKLVNKEFGLDKTYYVDVSPGESKRIINR